MRWLCSTLSALSVGAACSCNACTLRVRGMSSRPTVLYAVPLVLSSRTPKSLDLHWSYGQP